ncbi:S8 family serine peptidase [Roseiflexus sp.]|uniref:S8 family serine peptidase n=1 Tax=Roseiflexus sp. TaxID=2562120 RepID=UPI0021DD386D|nr:S8 family serine peptidase [Roseiflexus sp.]GIW01301.1 MAG: peptidase S8 [Roseiflexus sp.]
MKRYTTRLSLAAMTLLLSLILAALSPLRAVEAQTRPNRPTPGTPLTIEPATVTNREDLAVNKNMAVSRDGSMASVFLKIDSPSLATFMAQNGITDMNAPAAQNYLRQLNAELDALVARAKQLVPGLSVTHRFDLIIGGVAVVAPVGEIDKLRRLPNVVDVINDRIENIETYRTPAFIGATTAWGRGGGSAFAGEGVIFGVLDSGVWPEHPSFSDPDPLGKPYAPPPPAPGNPGGVRACDFGSATPGDAPFACNNKLIGSYRFMTAYDFFVGTEPYEFRSGRDDDGHGTHTASTAAGNRGVAASDGSRVFGVISGVAPRAYVVNYKVCGELGCFSTDSAAAVQQAIRDGVHVINFSISGGTNPYSDIASLAFLDAYNAGVLVSASAGNSGPAADTVNHREPWVATVGASTSDRSYLSTLTVQGSSGTFTAVGASSGAGIATPTQIVVNNADPLCLNPAAPGSFTGQIVVCQRGVIARVAKSANVAAGGAVGMILYNPSPSSLDADFHVIPTVHIQNTDGTALLAFLTANPGATATFTAGAPGSIQGDVMAGFSSRGGPGQTLGISKPDVTAPGVNILAGYTAIEYGTPVPQFAFLSGTSMSSPHNAGAAILLKWLHPTWTPGQIKSALMTTAKAAGVFKEDGVTPFTPFDAGSGRINLRKAWDPGLTFDETGANYVTLQNELWKANYPSLYVPKMPGLITVSRTAREVSGYDSFYKSTVSYQAGQPRDFTVTAPKEFFVPANGTYAFDITVDARNVPVGQVRHAVVIFTERNGCQVRFPITIVRGEPDIRMEKQCNPATLALRGTTDCTITISNTTFSNASVTLNDTMPRQLKLVSGSVTGGATEMGNGLTYSGTLTGAAPPDVSAGRLTFNGYLSLASLGASPNVSLGDESLVNITLSRPFLFGGQSYNTVAMVSNGYAVVGGGTAADISFVNRTFPNSARPNNTLGAFWTDLDGSAGGNYYAYLVGFGPCSNPANACWLILEWENAPNWSDRQVNTFQIWIGLNGVEDITYSYGPVLSSGDGGFVTVGAENAFGNRGANIYSNDNDGFGPVIGTIPTAGSNDVYITTTPGAPGQTVTIGFRAQGVRVGRWTNYAELTSPAFFGTYIKSFSGEVVRP